MDKQNSAETALTDLQIGEKLQIGLDESNQVYPTLLEDTMDDGRLIISGPLFRGIPVPLHAEQEIQLYFFRENGRYRIDAQVDRIFIHESLRLISLNLLSEPVKQQRRGSFRLPVNLDAFIRMLGDSPMPPKPVRSKEDAPNWETALTHNLSETGVSINSRSEYQIGDYVHIRLQLENHNDQVELLGMVRQIESIEIMQEPYWRMGIEFLPYEENLRRRVAKFILKKQQLVLKMKKNVGFGE